MIFSARIQPETRRAVFRAMRCLPLICCTVLCGCGGKDYTVAPVSGRVTLDNSPIAGVHVDFQPDSFGTGTINPGPGSYGTTDADGRYTLQTVEPTEPGAVVGRHRVRLSVSQENEGVDTDEWLPPPRVLPPECLDGSITFEVPPEGTDQADFDFVRSEH
jgi:hypothetical protein